MTNEIKFVPEPRRLVLAWQAPDHLNNRFRWAVALIEQNASGHVLRYLRPGAEFEEYNQGRPMADLMDLGYQGYPAFSLRREIHTANVVETFLRRLPPRTRPDFLQYVGGFSIASNAKASDLALLALTGAKLPSDGFSLVDTLNPETTCCDIVFEVAGFRYYCDNESSPSVGDPVELIPEPQNPYDRDAVQIVWSGRKIGNVNRLQARTVLLWLEEREITAEVCSVVHNSGMARASLFASIRPKSGGLQ